MSFPPRGTPPNSQVVSPQNGQPQNSLAQNQHLVQQYYSNPYMYHPYPGIYGGGAAGYPQMYAQAAQVAYSNSLYQQAGNYPPMANQAGMYPSVPVSSMAPSKASSPAKPNRTSVQTPGAIQGSSTRKVPQKSVNSENKKKNPTTASKEKLEFRCISCDHKIEDVRYSYSGDASKNLCNKCWCSDPNSSHYTRIPIRENPTSTVGARKSSGKPPRTNGSSSSVKHPKKATDSNPSAANPSSTTLKSATDQGLANNTAPETVPPTSNHPVASGTSSSNNTTESKLGSVHNVTGVRDDVHESERSQSTAKQQSSSTTTNLTSVIQPSSTVEGTDSGKEITAVQGDQTSSNEQNVRSPRNQTGEDTELPKSPTGGRTRKSQALLRLSNPLLGEEADNLSSTGHGNRRRTARRSGLAMDNMVELLESNGIGTVAPSQLSSQKAASFFDVYDVGVNAYCKFRGLSRNAKLSKRVYQMMCLIAMQLANVGNARSGGAVARAKRIKWISPLKVCTWDEMLAAAYSVLEQLRHLDTNESFSKPVDIKAYPNYRKHVTKRADLTSISESIFSGSIINDLPAEKQEIPHCWKKIWRKVHRVWNNAKRFNPPMHPLHLLADDWQEKTNNIQAILLESLAVETYDTEPFPGLERNRPRAKQQLQDTDSIPSPVNRKRRRTQPSLSDDAQSEPSGRGNVDTVSVAEPDAPGDSSVTLGTDLNNLHQVVDRVNQQIAALENPEMVSDDNSNGDKKRRKKTANKKLAKAGEVDVLQDDDTPKTLEEEIKYLKLQLAAANDRVERVCSVLSSAFGAVSSAVTSVK